MSRGVKWDEFAEQVRAQAGEWTDYPGQLANIRSAQTTAHLLRKRWPEFEVRQSKGVITVRVRQEVAQ